MNNYPFLEYIHYHFRPKLNDSAENAKELFQGIRPSLILIDFGVSIDMAVLPDKAQFEFQFEKQENRIPEMLDNKPWNYQVIISVMKKILHNIHPFNSYIY